MGVLLKPSIYFQQHMRVPVILLPPLRLTMKPLVYTDRNLQAIQTANRYRNPWAALYYFATLA